MAKTMNNGTESRSGRTGQSSCESVEKKNIKIGRHGIDMMVSDPDKQEKMLAQVGFPSGTPTPKSYEERVRLVQGLLSKSMGFDIPQDKVPSKIGFNINTDSQRKVLLGVLKLMTETDYRGDIQVPNSQVIKGGDTIVKRGLGTNGINITAKDVQIQGCEVRTGTHIGGAYQNIQSLPVLRITKRDLMIASGFNPEHGHDKRDFEKALSELKFNQNLLMWTRFAKDNKGRILLDKNHNQIKEIAADFSPVLRVVSIMDEKMSLNYYEISLPPVFLDEISTEYGGPTGGYFVLIPENSYNEVEEAYKRKYPSKNGYAPLAIQAFFQWLRLEANDKQNKKRNPRRKNPISDDIVISYPDLCCRLGYGQDTIVKNRKRILSAIDDAISIAQELGYIKGWSYNADTKEYTFNLNLSFYPDKYKKSEPENQENLS